MIHVSPAVAQIAAVARRAAVASRSWGCARCYVTFTAALDAPSKRNLSRAGFMLTPRPRHKGQHLYIGYDNATGLPYAQAEAAAAALNAAGVSCYADADED